MQYFIQFGLGFGMAIIGLLLPGMLNMTAVRTKIEKDSNSAISFSVGAALIVIPQVYIAVIFARYFTRHPEVLDRFGQFGAAVLLTLGLVFVYQAIKKNKAPKGRRRKGSLFILGMLLSSINMLAIPYYFFIGTLLKNKGWLILDHPLLEFFVSGAFLGTMTLFLLYIYFAGFIEKRAQYITNNINAILGVLFLFLGILAVIRQLN